MCSFENPVDCARSILKTVDHFNTVLKLALRIPPSEIGQSSSHRLSPIHIVKKDKPFHASSFVKDIDKIERARHGLGRIVLCNQPAENYSRSNVNEAQYSVQYRASHVFEVNIDTIGATLPQTVDNVVRLITEGRIEAELIG